MGNIERIVSLVGICAVMVCVGVMVWTEVRSPMAVRLANLEVDLGRIETVEELPYSESDVNPIEVDRLISGSKSLWTELVAPPKRVVKEAPGPDMAALLKGVVPSARNQIGSGDSLQIKIRTGEVPLGGWFKVGDTIRGVLIESIDDKSVVFMIKGKGKGNTKEYRHTLKRR